MKFLGALFLISLFLSSCSSLVYQPSPYMYFNPGSGTIAFEQIILPSLDHTELCAWYFPPVLEKGESSKGIIIQFHGNAQNMSSHFAWLTWALKKGYGFLAFDYRGYGRSKGSPSQEGLNQDAQAVIRYVMADPAKFHGDRKLVLYGQSLGGAVLLRALDDLTPEEKSKVSSVVIQSSFYSYRAIAKEFVAQSWLTYLFQPLVPLLMSDEMSPMASIPRVWPLPILVIHGDHDPVIPLSFGKEIFELAREPKEMLIIPGGGHLYNPPVQEEKMEKDILAFIEKH
jgi:fermentation-respiration switch protein FrsA (DUF1100 family)